MENATQHILGESLDQEEEKIKSVLWQTFDVPTLMRLKQVIRIQFLRYI